MISSNHVKLLSFSLGYTFIYSLPVIVVNRDDSVTINFFNIAETEDEGKEEEGRHSFTINTPPYRVDLDTAAGETGNATFTSIKKGSSNTTASTVLRL